jgi:polyhydroxybutyrate depolymerase
MDRVELKRPVPLIYIAGSHDPYTPIPGGSVKMPWRFSHLKPPVQPMLAKWAAANCGAGDPVKISSRRGIEAYAFNCPVGAEVVYYIVEGLGHVWPGGKPELPEKIVGKSSKLLNGCEVIWEFFKRHSLK